MGTPGRDGSVTTSIQIGKTYEWVSEVASDPNNGRRAVIVEPHSSSWWTVRWQTESNRSWEAIDLKDPSSYRFALAWTSPAASAIGLADWRCPNSNHPTSLGFWCRLGRKPAQTVRLRSRLEESSESRALIGVGVAPDCQPGPRLERPG